MARRTIESIETNTDPEDEFDEVTINYTESFGNRVYEQIIDNYVTLSRDEVVELHKALGDFLKER